MPISTILSALLGAVIGFAAAGLGAASLLSSTFGARDGGPAMNGFFYFGPIGAVAGALFGAGMVLRFAKRSLKWGAGLMIGSCIVVASGGMLLAIVNSPDAGPAYSEVIEFELECPSVSLAGVQIPSSSARWGAAGGDSDDRPISQFFTKDCKGDVCILPGAVAALGALNNFRITAAIGQKSYHYSIDLPAVVSGPIDWSAWRAGDGSRLRWRIVKR